MFVYANCVPLVLNLFLDRKNLNVEYHDVTLGEALLNLWEVICIHRERKTWIVKKIDRYTSTSVSIFSVSFCILYTFPLMLTWRIHFTIKASYVGDHFLYSHDRNECFSNITVMRNCMLVTLGFKRLGARLQSAIFEVFKTSVYMYIGV